MQHAVLAQLLHVRLLLQREQVRGERARALACVQVLQQRADNVHSGVQFSRCAQLVGNHKAVGVGVLDNLRGFGHLLDERRVRAVDVVVVARACKQLGVRRKLKPTRRHVQPRLRHQHTERNAFEQRRLAHAIDPVQQPALLRRQVHVVGHVPLLLLLVHEQPLNQRVPQLCCVNERRLLG